MSEKTIVQWVNPEVLRWARKRLNLNPEDVEIEAEKLKKHFYEPVTADEIVAWEEGKSEPSLAQLETLAEIYVCPVGYFFLENPPVVSVSLSFRGLSDEKRKDRLSSLTLRSLERFTELVEWTTEMIRRSGITWQVLIKPASVTPKRDDPERVAIKYRDLFGWGPHQREKLNGNVQEAFRWWRQALEDRGIFCFELPLDPKDVRGASIWYENFPFILVNHRDSEAGAGRLFTLLHEFAHLISANEGIACDFRGVHRESNPEPFANRFAARLLILHDEFVGRLEELGENRYRDHWSDKLLDVIREPFMVSRDVVAIYLEELDLAPKGFYETKRERWQRRVPWGHGGRRPTKYEQKLQELGFSLTRVLLQASEMSDFSWMDLASITEMKVEKAAEFLNWIKERAD